MAQQNDTKLISELLKRIANAIDKGDYDYLHDLRSVPRRKEVSSKSDRVLYAGVILPNREKSQNPSYPEGGDMYDEKSANEQFAKFGSTEDLRDYISRIYPKKADVILLAKGFRVHTSKSDDYDAIIDRIVDATLGYKLRSRAVRGESISLEKTVSERTQIEKSQEPAPKMDRGKLSD